MSTHECPVVEITLEPHPNADTLSLVRIDGYTVCVKTDDWKDKKLGVYIPPDYVVDTNLEQFRFLACQSAATLDAAETKRLNLGPYRIKVKKFRQQISHGLLLPAPEGAVVGENYLEKWGITRYEPPDPATTRGEAEGAPKVFAPKYDVEGIRGKYLRVLQEGEEVVITEKIHGCNSRFVYAFGRDDTEPRMFCGSRTEWKRFDSGNLWWKVLARFPGIEQWCRAHPNMVLYGETFGQVQDLKYGAGQDEYFFRAFDILRDGQWISWYESQKLIVEGVDPATPVLWVPVVYVGPFSMAAAEEFAVQDSLIPKAKHLREGVVIKPTTERYDHKLGRVILKLVSDRYLSR